MSSRLTNQRAIDGFAEISNEYCQLIEKHSSMKVPAFLLAVESLLPSLYVRALALPNVEPSSADDESAADGDRWKELYEGLKAS